MKVVLLLSVIAQSSHAFMQELINPSLEAHALTFRHSSLLFMHNLQWVSLGHQLVASLSQLPSAFYI